MNLALQIILVLAIIAWTPALLCSDILLVVVERCTPLRGHASLGVSLMLGHFIFYYAAASKIWEGSAAAAAAAIVSLFDYMSMPSLCVFDAREILNESFTFGSYVVFQSICHFCIAVFVLIFKTAKCVLIIVTICPFAVFVSATSCDFFVLKASRDD